MPDPTIHILSTRPLAKELLDQGRTRGIAIEALSFIETETSIDATLAQHIRRLSRQPIIAVFTSMNAVEAVAQYLPDPRWRIFCIGAATRELVSDHFGEDRIEGTAPSALALADMIIRRMERKVPPEVFFFCGDQRRDELPDRLKEASIRVNEIVVYHTRPTPHKIRTNYDGIAFFSPSAVHSFFTINTVPHATVLFAIGTTTAAAIRTYTSNRTIVSTAPEKQALIRQAIDYFQTDNTTDTEQRKS
jgi:uroporphyrinogen-III synthase